MVEQKFTVPLGGHLFKGVIDRVDLIPGTENEVAIIDYKTGGGTGTGRAVKTALAVCAWVQTPVSRIHGAEAESGTAVEAETAGV